MIITGSVYNTCKCGLVKILDANQSKRYYRVRFLNTGTEKLYREDQILSGSLRDPYARQLCGVACTGDVKTKGKNKYLYSVWHDMINRCYNKNNKKFKAYSNVSVSDRWLIFENFLEDAQHLDGFDHDEIASGNLVLDKDSKQRWKQNKVYSPETCCWIDKHTNNQIQDAQQRPFVAVSPNGECFEAYNITQFAREHNLDRRHISGVLHGRCNTTCGWRFTYQ